MISWLEMQEGSFIITQQLFLESENAKLVARFPVQTLHHHFKLYDCRDECPWLCLLV